MGCARSLVGAGLIVVLLLSLPAWAQAPAVEKDLLDAIQTLKDTANRDVNADRGFRTRLSTARTNLRRSPDKSLDLLVALLDENNVQIRLNGAISLADLADEAARQKTPNPKLVAPLTRCLNDSNSGLVYWGLVGLCKEGIPESAQIAAVRHCLEMKQPQVIRMTAAALAGQLGLKRAMPDLIAYLKVLLPGYEKKVKDMLAIRATVAGDAAAPAADAGGAVPPPAAVAPRGGPATTTAVPAREVIVGYIIPERDWRDSTALLEQKAREFEDQPAIAELHHAGVVIEDLAKTNPQDQPFTPAGAKEAVSFLESPPWRLRPVVDAAVAWYEANRARFEAAPKPAAEKPPTPKPAETPAEKPAEPAPPPA